MVLLSIKMYLTISMNLSKYDVKKYDQSHVIV